MTVRESDRIAISIISRVSVLMRDKNTAGRSFRAGSVFRQYSIKQVNTE